MIEYVEILDKYLSKMPIVYIYISTMHVPYNFSKKTYMIIAHNFSKFIYKNIEFKNV